MRLILPLLAAPCLLVSCIPENTGGQSSTAPAPAPANNSPAPPTQTLEQDRLREQGARIGRLETELHEMRLLFTNQLKRIEEVANRPTHLPATAYQQQAQQQPQQVVIMPNSPVVTHRWDQQDRRTAASAYPRGYEVRSGDTLSQIAEAHGVPTTTLLTANPGINPLNLRIGTRLTIPSASQAAQYAARAQTQARGYSVQSGDTLSQIAETYGIGLSQLMAANPGINPRRLQIGKRLTIPSSYQAPRQHSSQPTGYASPPLQSIQREPQSAPQSSTLYPQYNSHPQRPTSQEPTHRKPIKVPKSTTFGQIAIDVGTDVDTLNRLNHCALSASSRIPTNGLIYVPANP